MRWFGVLGLVVSLGACKPEPRPVVANVGHSAHASGGVHCSRCHQGMEVAEEASSTHLPTDEVCVECHRGEGHEPGKCTEVDRCTECHVDDDAHGTLERRGEALIFSHKNHLQREKGECVTCHTPGVTPTMEDCRPCHDAWLDSLACGTCHKSLSAYPLVPVTHQAHGADFLRRHGAEARVGADRCATCHAQAFCADCHDNRRPFTAATAWSDRPDRNFIHRPNFEARHAWSARQEPQTCLGCHSEQDCATCHEQIGRGVGGLSPHPAGWASAGPGPNLHSREARYDLLGCAACHSGAGSEICVTCHAVGGPGGSPHEGREPRGDTGRQPCVRCHRGVR